MATARLTDGREVQFESKPFAYGATKRVYWLEDHSGVVALYKSSRIQADPNRLTRLNAILGKYNPTSSPADAARYGGLFNWPTGIVESPGLGLVLPAYPSWAFFERGILAGRPRVADWFVSACPDALEQIDPAERGNLSGLLRAAVRLARAVRRLHAAGLAHSDLSFNNVLLNPTTGNALVIDIDGLVVPGLHPPDVLGTPGYVAPEVVATLDLPCGDPGRMLPSAATDLHALAVLFYELFTKRHPLEGSMVCDPDPAQNHRLSYGSRALWCEDPGDRRNALLEAPRIRYTDLGRHMAGLFERAFAAGLHHPGRRPGAAEWELALQRSRDLLLPCSGPDCLLGGFFYSGGKRLRCPWCGTELAGPLPVLELQAHDGSDWVPSGQTIVGLPGDEVRPLMKHHFGGVPTLGDREVQAELRHWKGQWVLVNRRLRALRSANGNAVPAGRVCSVRDGTVLTLADGPRGCKARISFVGR